MSCIKTVNVFDRWLLGTRDREEAERRAHEPTCRLLVERLKAMTLIALLIAVLGAGVMWTLARREAAAARQTLADIVATDCIDRPGDVSYRNLLADLTALNERRPPLPPAEQRQRTARLLRQALDEAGPAPACILDGVP